MWLVGSIKVLVHKMADCWVVVKVETGVGLRVDLMVEKMAIEGTVGLAMSCICWMATWMADYVAALMVLAKIVSTFGWVGVGEAAEGAGLVIAGWV